MIMLHNALAHVRRTVQAREHEPSLGHRAGHRAGSRVGSGEAPGGAHGAAAQVRRFESGERGARRCAFNLCHSACQIPEVLNY